MTTPLFEVHTVRLIVARTNLVYWELYVEQPVKNGYSTEFEVIQRCHSADNRKCEFVYSEF